MVEKKKDVIQSERNLYLIRRLKIYEQFLRESQYHPTFYTSNKMSKENVDFLWLSENIEAFSSDFMYRDSDGVIHFVGENDDSISFKMEDILDLETFARIKGRMRKAVYKRIDELKPEIVM